MRLLKCRPLLGSECILRIVQVSNADKENVPQFLAAVNFQSAYIAGKTLVLGGNFHFFQNWLNA